MQTKLNLITACLHECYFSVKTFHTTDHRINPNYDICDLNFNFKPSTLLKQVKLNRFQIFTEN